MKFLVAVVLCLAVTAVFADVAELKAKLRAANKKCQEDPKTAVDKDDLKKYVDSKGKEPEPANIGPHALCVSKELNWQNADGTINREHLKEKISAAGHDNVETESILNECAVAEENEIATARHLFKCFYKHIKEEAQHH